MSPKDAEEQSDRTKRMTLRYLRGQTENRSQLNCGFFHVYKDIISAFDFWHEMAML
ncbi:hypothetical protein PHOSAC3_90290 [Mesotoga infera]|nr:hypothetical protein PHOSAC3_90290 [Mesotoga infera]